MMNSGNPGFQANTTTLSCNSNLADIEWVKQWFNKPAMTGNGNYTTYKKMLMTGGWFMKFFYPH